MLEFFHVGSGVKRGCIQMVVMRARSQIESACVGSWVPGNGTSILALFPFKFTCVCIVDASSAIAYWKVVVCLLGPLLWTQDAKGGIRDIESVLDCERMHLALIIFDSPFHSTNAFGTNICASKSFDANVSWPDRPVEVRFIV